MEKTKDFHQMKNNFYVSGENDALNAIIKNKQMKYFNNTDLNLYFNILSLATYSALTPVNLVPF